MRRSRLNGNGEWTPGRKSSKPKTVQAKEVLAPPEPVPVTVVVVEEPKIYSIEPPEDLPPRHYKPKKSKKKKDLDEEI